MRRTNAFYHALKHARLKQGRTQEDFDQISSRTYISLLERDLRTPTLDKLDDLAQVLDIHPLTLIALAYLSEFTPAAQTDLLSQLKKDLTRFTR